MDLSSSLSLSTYFYCHGYSNPGRHNGSRQLFRRSPDGHNGKVQETDDNAMDELRFNLENLTKNRN